MELARKINLRVIGLGIGLFLVVQLCFLTNQSRADQPPNQPANTQELFSIKIQLGLSKFWTVSMDEIHTEVPVSVITDEKENIIGLQLSGEGGVPIHLKMRDGTNRDITMNAMASSSENFLKKQYRISVTGPHPRDLFIINASKLNPQQGGVIDLSYSSSPLLGTLNKVQVNIKKVGHKWAAETVNDPRPGGNRIFTRMNIASAAGGMILDEPDYQFDPNQLSSIMKFNRISDPRIAEQQFKHAEEVIQDKIAHPYPLGSNSAITLSVESAK